MKIGSDIAEITQVVSDTLPIVLRYPLGAPFTLSTPLPPATPPPACLSVAEDVGNYSR